ncbi:MAG: serine/threonine protein kinase [Polyangiaceae bacterium]|nr:serine/threonine protein kinase [Polyangiaceae bacterium]
MSAVAAAPGFEARRRMAGAKLGRYQVGPRIGVGGSAAVYLGRMTGPMSFERLVAIKVVHDHLSEEREFISQFLDEANLLVRVAHPNIVQVQELGREGETLFLAMEYLHGQPLSKLISGLARRGTQLDPVLVAWLGARVAEGLGYAHEMKDDQGQPLGLVHRDVCPQNVFLTYKGEVKLIDFGIARAAGRIAQTTLGRVKGKFSYMAPEQVLGRDFDHRVDLFALGATLYETAVGARLFSGIDESETLHKLLFEEIPDPTARVQGFPPALAKVLMRALKGEPDQRHQSARELAQELDDFVRMSGVERPQAMLAECLNALFESDRKAQEESIEALRTAGFDTVTESAVLDRSSGVVTVRPEPAKARGVWPYAAAGFAVVLTVGALGLALKRDRVPVPAPSPLPSAAAAATDVSVEVTTQPDVEATVLVAGVSAQGRPRRATLPRGEAPVTIEVSAPGFESTKVSVVPDRDRGVVVPLTKLAEPASSASSKPNPKGTRPPVIKKPGDPLVTQYPFGKK